MKIAILTTARSGSTSLYHLIEETLIGKKYVCVSEPFNFYWRNISGLNTYDVDFLENKKNVFVKTFVSKSQIPKKYANNESDYWDWFFDYFDKVIILDRKDKDLQSESLTYHMKMGELANWHKKQYYSFSKIKKEEIDYTKSILIEDSKKKHEFSKMGYPIFYFEDIFIDKNKETVLKLFEYIDLELRDDLYEKYINSDFFKVRMNKNENRFNSLI